MIDLKTFVLAGAAIFTLQDESGKHFTYRVNKAATKGTWPRTDQTAYFVQLGINYNESIYMGFVLQNNNTGEAGNLVLSGKSRVNQDSPSYRMFTEWWLHIRHADAGAPTRIQFRHEGKCCVCARLLTNPESINKGIGPECEGKMG